MKEVFLKSSFRLVMISLAISSCRFFNSVEVFALVRNESICLCFYVFEVLKTSNAVVGPIFDSFLFMFQICDGFLCLLEGCDESFDEGDVCLSKFCLFQFLEFLPSIQWACGEMFANVVGPWWRYRLSR